MLDRQRKKKIAVKWTHDIFGTGLILTSEADVKRTSDRSDPTETSIVDWAKLW
jgi:hypothetical protein